VAGYVNDCPHKARYSSTRMETLQVQDFSPADAFSVPNLCPERTAFVVR
jgi:hypothetical protein